MKPQRVLIIGAAGRDFHNFNTVFRDDPDYEVVAFTAAQIPDIAGRIYPPSLAGERYPEGIPIYDESELERLIEDLSVDVCVFSYSDLPYSKVMGIGSRVNAAGANFMLLCPKSTMIESTKPVIAVTATRTGCGKSQTSRRVAEILEENGKRAIVLRHPMPYGNLQDQAVQRLTTIDDLAMHHCTIEEMEEYEPFIARGMTVYAGVDYEAILRAAETDPDGCDVILWDGGNNDVPFVKPDLTITVVDPHRAGHELLYYPSETNLRLADVVVINKIDSADPADVKMIRENIASINPDALVVDAESTVTVDDPGLIEGKRVLVIEDGPTVTHGEMKIGAGSIAAKRYNAAEIIDPRPFVVGKIAQTYETYPGIGMLLPAMGYSDEQRADLERTIDRAQCDCVVIATPIDLARVLKINKPHAQVTYELHEISSPDLADALDGFLKSVA
ncbi:MAG: cyclic 2,3-diphosphoglycerate synthase [Coriobacteriia bacterium]|nr:cyclic 2,3-diphosphoglycerate synthase [Coriobacteriia bacterium]